MQFPRPPTLMESYLMAPFLMSSAKDIVGCAELKASTACLHPAGMIVLIVGLFVRAVPEVDDIWALAGAAPPRNLASGQVSIMSMVQSSTNQATNAPRVDLRAGAGVDHRLHARKNWRAS